MKGFMILVTILEKKTDKARQNDAAADPGDN